MRNFSFQVGSEFKAQSGSLRNLDEERARYRPVIVEIVQEPMRYGSTTFGRRSASCTGTDTLH
jgi:hypothetical protein